ncbi:MAG: phage holin family protein [Bacteroidetes bacterium]|nr:phage holin family protein [Bacteroidota bacterium]
MHEEFKKVEEAAGHFKSYVNNKITQVKVGVAEKVSDVLSIIIAKTIIAFVIYFAVLFGSAAAAYALGAYFGKMWLGCLIVAGFYFLVGIVIWLSRERVLRIPILNGLINRLFIDEIKNHEKN